MTSIYDIPYEDIKIFLLANNQNIENKDDSYKLASLLLKDKKTVGHTTSIIEWMIAHNLLIKKVNIPNYTIEKIDNMTQTGINKLAKKLTMTGNNRENIKNILRYLHKLDEDFLLPELKDLIFNKLTKLELQNIKFYEMSLNEIIELLKTHRNKETIRKFISDNLEKIIGYHSIRLNDPNYADYVLSDIFHTSNIYNKNIMIEIIKDNRSIFLKYHDNEEINDYIKGIEETNNVYDIYLEDIFLDDFVNFTLNLIAIDEIGLAKQTFNIINKFLISGRNYSYNYELVKYAISSDYTNVLKIIINFMGENQFVEMFDKVFRDEHPDSIKEFLFNLIRLREYNVLINILKTLSDYLRHNYRGGVANKIDSILEKIEKAIKSKDDNTIIMYIKNIQTILDNPY